MKSELYVALLRGGGKIATANPPQKCLSPRSAMAVCSAFAALICVEIAATRHSVLAHRLLSAATSKLGDTRRTKQLGNHSSIARRQDETNIQAKAALGLHSLSSNPCSVLPRAANMALERACSYRQLINDGGIEVKQAIVTIIAASLLALAGCSQPEIPPTPTTSPTATPAAATPAPTAAQSGDLQKAAEQVEKGLGEWQNKNYRGALDWINAAQREVTATLNNLNAPAPIKTSLEQTQAELDKVKALVEKRDPAAEKSLNALVTQISKLAERVQNLSSQPATGAAKGSAEKTVPKKQ